VGGADGADRPEQERGTEEPAGHRSSPGTERKGADRSRDRSGGARPRPRGKPRAAGRVPVGVIPACGGYTLVVCSGAFSVFPPSTPRRSRTTTTPIANTQPTATHAAVMTVL